MHNVTFVLAKLQDAIKSLESREQDLTSLERLKLKALRLNLDAAQDVPAETASRTGTICQFPRSDGLMADRLEEKLRALQTLSRQTRAETKRLLAEASTHVARGRSLCDAVRLAGEHAMSDGTALPDALAADRSLVTAAAT
jgi:hypothetical protein